jgi:8-oxo-dGTP pyrophosphatase MutT (NUDIX family)
MTDRAPTTCWLGPRFEAALAYALHVHGGQVRKGTAIPYAGHLLAVAATVIDDGGDEDQAIGALLHDAAEDQGGRDRLADIRARFGERVARIVEGCTDTFEDPKPPWLPRKEQYLHHLPDAPEDVRRVSAADKLHNARAILADYRRLGETLWPRFRAPRNDQLWYFRRLVDIYQDKGPASLAGGLARVVTELHRLALNAPGPADVGKAWTHHVQAGGVVFVEDQVVLRHSRAGHWVLPKGHVGPGETPREAAEREVLEETGIHARVARPLGAVAYTLGDGYHEVECFTLEAVALEAEWERHQTQDASLLSPDEARRRLSFESYQEILNRALAGRP